MFLAFLTQVLILSGALASPLGWESFILEERSSASAYYTNVSLSPQKVTFGSVTPEDAITAAMGCACKPGTAICDIRTSQECLTVQTTVYRDRTQPPENAELVFAPGSNTYAVDVGPLYVQALASIAAAAKSCQVESWVQTRSGEDGSHSATFCGLSQEILVQRLSNPSGAPVDQMSFSVTMQLEPSISFSWCDLPGILGAIAGVFTGGAALAAAFGVDALVCNDAGGSS